MLSRRQFIYLCGGLLSGCAVNNREPDYTVVIRHQTTFEPSSLVIPVGSMVVWHNRTDQVHTITADPAKAQMPARILIPPGSSPFDSGDLYAGERWVYTFEVPGIYVYFCRYYEMEEMLGSITITA